MNIILQKANEQENFVENNEDDKKIYVCLYVYTIWLFKCESNWSKKASCHSNIKPMCGLQKFKHFYLVCKYIIK